MRRVPRRWSRRSRRLVLPSTAISSPRRSGSPASRRPRTRSPRPRPRSASGSATQVERAFSTTLGTYKVSGKDLRLANTALSIPASIAGVVAGVVGVNQSVATNDLSAGAANVPAQTATSPTQEPPPPAAFKNPQPCAGYFGEKTDTTDNASLYAPFTHPQPYDICGYKPAQLQGAYGLTSKIAAGNNGHGVSLAIVDAYGSPTLLADAQQYFNLNAPTIPLTKGQFKNIKPSSVGNESLCGASGWFAEQALDVESSHSMRSEEHTSELQSRQYLVCRL